MKQGKLYTYIYDICIVFITYALEAEFCVLCRTHRQDYETLFHVVILIKHHHR
jgi:hypothetical protein